LRRSPLRSSTVIGHSRPHASQHQFRRTDAPLIVCSGFSRPAESQNLQRSGTRNVSRLYATRSSPVEDRHPVCALVNHRHVTLTMSRRWRNHSGARLVDADGKYTHASTVSKPYAGKLMSSRARPACRPRSTRRAGLRRRHTTEARWLPQLQRRSHLRTELIIDVTPIHVRHAQRAGQQRSRDRRRRHENVTGGRHGGRKSPEGETTATTVSICWRLTDAVRPLSCRA
jgi:hypothetical protein